MADVLTGKDDYDVQMDLWKKTGFAKMHAMKHSVDADETAGIAELSNTILEARAPSAIGRDICNVRETTNQSVKIRKPDLAIATDSQNFNLSIEARGERNEFIDISVDDEIISGDVWGQKAMEDAEWNLAQAQTAAIGEALSRLETTKILSQYESITPSQQAGGQALSKSGTLVTANDLITARGRIAKENADPNTIVINPENLAELMQDDAFQDNNILGSTVNYNTGSFGTFMRMNVYESSLVKEGDLYVLDKNRVLYYVIRRDRYMSAFEMPVQRTGIAVSTRYGMGIGDTKSFIKISV